MAELTEFIASDAAAMGGGRGGWGGRESRAGRTTPMPQDHGGDDEGPAGGGDGGGGGGGEAGNADRQAGFAVLLARHHVMLMSYVLSLVPSWSDAEDIVQETSAVLWRKFADFEPGTSFLAWSCQVARFHVWARPSGRGRWN